MRPRLAALCNTEVWHAVCNKILNSRCHIISLERHIVSLECDIVSLECHIVRLLDLLLLMGVFYGSGLLVCYVTMDSSWCNFFSELNRLFDSCQNQIGVANERYVNYAIERLEHGFKSR